MSERYRLIRELGEGSFGKCYLVENSSKQQCVIKQIDIRGMSEKEKMEAIKEARILKQLSHPNIIKFRDAYTSKRGKLCIVMDYADGGDLQKKIENQQGRHFTENQIIDWFVQICLALKHIHDRKILHRDLKTQNIFLTQSQRAVLGDFGISRVLNNSMDNARTMVGTPYYLSPEIIENRPYNLKSDIWSLGVILYELCSLRPPFDASSLHFLALKIVRGNYPPLPDTYSQNLRNLVSRMLDVNPDQRPTIKEIINQNFIKARIQDFLSQSMQAQEFQTMMLLKRPEGGWHRAPRIEDRRARPEEFKPQIATPQSRFAQNRFRDQKGSQTPSEEQKNFQAFKPMNSPMTPQRSKSQLNQPAGQQLEDDRQQMISNIRERRNELRQNENQEEAKNEAMICEMKEVVLQGEDYESSTTDNEPSEPTEDEKEDREDVIQEEDSPAPIEPLPATPFTNERTRKVDILRTYLQERIGVEQLDELYAIIVSMDEIQIGAYTYEQYYEALRHILNREQQKEYLPLIQALIYMDSNNQ